MNKPVAILLLLIHIFNVGGYRFVFDKLEKDASVQLIDKLDNEEYSDDQLIEMKVPLPMPYQTNWASFERYNGEIQIEGVHYNYVKRKVWNDTLILLCIPNHDKMQLNSAKEQFFSLVNDLDQQGKDMPAPKANIVKSITTDYQATETMAIPVPPVEEMKTYTILHSSMPPSVALDDPYQPPRA
ncbi:MAG TPA: hypothetical protein VFX73_01640 [Chitinophagaceae bacterium]|nr:hypothetical protein [Chitinophagaceae bacterium]